MGGVHGAFGAQAQPGGHPPQPHDQGAGDEGEAHDFLPGSPRGAQNRCGIAERLADAGEGVLASAPNGFAAQHFPVHDVGPTGTTNAHFAGMIYMDVLLEQGVEDAVACAMGNVFFSSPAPDPREPTGASLAHPHVEPVLFRLDAGRRDSAVGQGVQRLGRQPRWTADVAGGVGSDFPGDGAPDVAVEHLHQPDVSPGVQGAERIPVHGAFRVSVGIDHRRQNVERHEGVEEAPHWCDAAPRSDEQMVRLALLDAERAEGARDAGLDRSGQVLDERGNASGASLLDTKDDAFAFPAHDGKGTASGTGVEVHFEDDELPGLKTDVPEGGQHGHFGRFVSETGSGMDGDRPPHRREVKEEANYASVTRVAEGLEFPTTVNILYPEKADA